MISSKINRAIFLILFALAIVMMFFEWRQIHSLADQNRRLTDEVNQLCGLREADQKVLSRRQSSDELHQSEHNELLRLRSKASELKDAERENTRLRSQLDQLASGSAQPVPANANSEKEQSPEEQ